jgi:hypothetical protein
VEEKEAGFGRAAADWDSRHGAQCTRLCAAALPKKTGTAALVRAAALSRSQIGIG